MSSKTNYAAPVASIDLSIDGEIWPCTECMPWHLEVVRDPETGDVMVREWHAAECPWFLELLRED